MKWAIIEVLLLFILLNRRKLLSHILIDLFLQTIRKLQVAKQRLPTQQRSKQLHLRKSLIWK